MKVGALGVVVAAAVVLGVPSVAAVVIVGGGVVAAATACTPPPRSPSPSPDADGASASPATDPCPTDAMRPAGPSGVAGLPGSVLGPDVEADIAVAAAIAAVGRGGQYVAEGNGPVNFDCSGLTAYAWRQAGVYLSDYSYDQRAETADIPRSAVAPGDLVFWFGGSEHHVAIVIAVNGDTIMIAEASNPQTDLDIRPLGNGWDAAYLTGFGRVVR